MNKTKRILSLTLALIMLLCLFPISALAASLGDVVLTVCANEDAGLGGDVAVEFNKSGNNYAGTLYLPGSADTSKLFFSWSDGVTVADQESGAAPVAAAGQSVSYTVSFGGQTATFTVTTMQGSVGVEGMFLTVDESRGTIAAMNGDLDHETSCYGSVVFGGKSYFMSMKGRGNTTWAEFDKKPYNITVYKDDTYAKKDGVKLIDDVKAKKWSILANAKDPTCLRNKIGYDIAYALGIGLPSESVDIWMNGEYLGNYLLTPKNDYQTPKNGYLMEIDNLGDVDQFTLDGIKFTLKDVGENEITGEDLTLAEVKPTVQEAFNALKKSDDSYLDYFDLDSWAKMYLLNELYKDVDVSAGSIFFSKKSLTSGKLTAGPIWDLDGTLGRVSRTYIGMDHTHENDGSGWYIDAITGTAFFQYLGKHESFMKRVYEIYNENKTALDGILADLDAQSTLIADSARMDFGRWPQYKGEEHFKVSNTTTYGRDAYAVTYVATNCWEDYVSNLKEYITKRLTFFADTLTPQTPTGSISGRTKLAVGDTMTLTANVNNAGSITYQWQSSADGEIWADIAGATHKTYSTAMTADMAGMSFRCVVTNAPIIETVRVAKAPIPAAEATLDAVTVTVHVHDYTASITAPNCTERGYTTHTCVECEDSYVDTYTDALGHNYQNGRCTRCGAAQPTQPGGGGGSGSTSFLGSIINAIRQMFTNFFEFFARIFSFGR